MHVSPILLALLFCPLAPSQIAGRLTAQPPLSPEEAVAVEARIAANPEDVSLRLRLLENYLISAPPYDDPVKRASRLRHILYLVEHSPDALDPASPLVYVARSAKPYANEGDHEMVRSLWLRLAEAHPLKAAWFLFVEHKQEAEDLLRRAVERDPGNQRLAANLGFLYALQILGLDGFAADVPPAVSVEAKQRAIAELNASMNPAVLAGAGAAIPNLAMRASRGAPVDPELFQLGSKLMARARALAPDDEAFRGPMPMIEYFQEAQGVRGGNPPVPSRIRVGANIQRAKLIHAPEPTYPEYAKANGISGDVSFTAIIARDGTVAALTLRSGHPLLVQAATEAVRHWRYQPTLLNGTPVEVTTEIVVSFPPKK